MYSNVSDFIITMSSGKMERISQSLTLFGNQGFQLTIFGILITLKSFARNIVKCDFFLDFQIPWDFPVNGELEMQNREKALWLTSSSSRRHFWVRFTVCRSISRFGSESFLTSFIHPWNQSKKLEGRLNLIAFLSRDLEKSLVGISLQMMANLDVPREV